MLDVPGFQEPVIGQLVSLPERAEPRLNRLTLRQGRTPRLGHPDEAVLLEPFAQAHGLELGDTLRAVINGRWRELTVVGIALSPEYVYAIGPGALMPDDRRFGVLWLGQEALQAAFDLDGAFNDVSLALLRGTDPGAVVDRVDRLLGRYGGVGAYARGDQLSNWFLMSEIDQHRTLSTILPTVFLAVAAFLTHMVLGRLIAVERAEIGLLAAILGTLIPGVKTLRDVELDLFREHADQLPPDVRRRCRFIIEENQRVLDLSSTLPAGDGEQIRKLTQASFHGARELYEIVSPEMEEMMTAMLEAPGAIGARQAGAGFGGCMVAFVQTDAVSQFSDQVRQAYFKATQVEPQICSVSGEE